MGGRFAGTFERHKGFSMFGGVGADVKALGQSGSVRAGGYVKGDAAGLTGLGGRVTRAPPNQPRPESMDFPLIPKPASAERGPRQKDMGQAMAAFDRTKTTAPPLLCAKCGSDDDSMIEIVAESARKARTYFCNICSHEWTVQSEPVGRFESIEQLVQRTGLRRDELATLVDIGALNAFTHDRRSELWQVERAVRRREGEQAALQGTARAGGADTGRAAQARAVSARRVPVTGDRPGSASVGGT